MEEDHTITIPQEINKRAKSLGEDRKDPHLGGCWRAVELADALKSEAAAVVARLHAMRIEVWMISGDNPRTAKAVASQLTELPRRCSASR
jgi:cation-transporting ATPase V